MLNALESLLKKAKRARGKWHSSMVSTLVFGSKDQKFKTWEIFPLNRIWRFFIELVLPRKLSFYLTVCFPLKRNVSV